MSEYWVSKKRYFCQYCEIYITDDAPSRQHHENGMRHKGNKERFVRSLYKAGEKRKKDAEEEKREMVRIEQAAQAAFSQDVGAGHAKASSSSVLASAAAAAASSSKKPPPRPTDKFANYSTAQSLGYTDPDLERAQAEAERRRSQGVAGEWQYVQSTPPPASGSREASADVHDETKAGAGTAAVSEDRKRSADVLDDGDESGRGWKLRKKTATVGLGELYDPGLIPIKLKPKKEDVKEDVSQPQSSGIIGEDASRLAAGAGPATEGPAPSSVPKWTATKWRKAGEEDKGDSTVSSIKPSAAIDTDKVKEGSTEISDPPRENVKLEESAPVKLEPSVEPQLENASAGSLFRKRRLPASGGVAGRGRRF
ncbi:hypothetical protein DENSPDRAFT_780857 [Dentipellis sp. KUC8613]|nr:hypothetical protein DENSPDRAFT_780857 [Dentipellis sp. KUC8613]